MSYFECFRDSWGFQKFHVLETFWDLGYRVSQLLRL